jgi:hypothetical protein
MSRVINDFDDATTSTARGVYLDSVTVAGFRGILLTTPLRRSSPGMHVR